MMNMIPRPVSVILLSVLLIGAMSAGAQAADEAPTQPPEVTEPPPKPKVDVRKLFATNCSWCHQDYGMKAADGPRLAGTRLTFEQVIERIQRGKTPMPGFRKLLNQDQIEALATYIKGLKDPGD